MKKINTPNAPQPAGHYSQATVHNGLVFVSGQLSIDPATRERKLGPIAEQTQQTLENVLAIVEAAGSSLENILKMTVYVADISLWDEVNEVYTAFFGTHKPARAIVPTKALHHGFLIEIASVAAVME